MDGMQAKQHDFQWILDMAFGRVPGAHDAVRCGLIHAMTSQLSEWRRWLPVECHDVLDLALRYRKGDDSVLEAIAQSREAMERLRSQLLRGAVMGQLEPVGIE
jgi:hypothetical protein